MSSPKLSTNDPLTEDERHILIKELAQFLPPAKAPEWIQKNFNKKVSIGYAYQLINGPKWRPLLDRYRQEWALGIVEVPIASKRYRMQKLQSLLDSLENDVHLRQSVKEQRMLWVLDRARFEMESAKVSETHNVFLTQINNYTEEELLKRRDELLRRIQSYPFKTRRRIANGLGNGCEESKETEGVIDSQGNGGNKVVGDSQGNGTVEGKAS